MLHLQSERLAALADDEPTAGEAIHLASCPRCAVARRLHQDLFAASRTHGAREQAPLTSWDTLAPKLAAAGLIVAPGTHSGFASRGVRRVAAIAAAVALVAGGTAAGRLSAGASPVPASLFGRGAAQSVAQLPADFSSKAEALNVYLTAQKEIQRAATYLNASDETPRESQKTILNRLAALDEMHAASLAALREAPTDPVLNNYYVSTANAREATRQQITRMIPAGSVVKSY